MSDDEWKDHFRKIFQLQRKMVFLQIGQWIFGFLTAASVAALIFMLLLLGDK